ncbi:MAG: hypothetical protein AAF333_08355 [Planctomycetota bacterium]
MNSGQTIPIDTPRRFEIDKQTYTLVTLAETLYDDSGEEILTRVDHDRKLFILSDKCRGRHAVLGILTMVLSAWERERDSKNLSYDQLHMVASAVERFMVDLGLEDAALQSLQKPGHSESSGPEPEPEFEFEPPAFEPEPAPAAHAPRKKTQPAVLVGAGLVAAAALSVWWMAQSETTAPQPGLADSPGQIFSVSSGRYADLSHGQAPTQTPFAAPTHLAVCHPTDPAFAMVAGHHEVRRVALGGTDDLLLSAGAPIISLSVSPNGRYLAACDTEGTLYRLDWEQPAPAYSRQADSTRPASVTVDDRGQLTWLDFQQDTYTLDPETNQSRFVLGYEQYIPSPSAERLTVAVRTVDGSRQIEVLVGGLPLPLTVQLTEEQTVIAADTSDDGQIIGVLLRDDILDANTLLAIGPGADGNYPVRKTNLNSGNGIAQLRLSPDGRHAMAATDRVYLVDLDTMRIASALDTPQRDEAILDLAWDQATGEIKAATTQGGYRWR